MRVLQVAPRKLPWPGGFLEYTHDKKMGTCCTVKKTHEGFLGTSCKTLIDVMMVIFILCHV